MRWSVADLDKEIAYLKWIITDMPVGDERTNALARKILEYEQMRDDLLGERPFEPMTDEAWEAALREIAE